MNPGQDIKNEYFRKASKIIFAEFSSLVELIFWRLNEEAEIIVNDDMCKEYIVDYGFGNPMPFNIESINYFNLEKNVIMTQSAAELFLKGYLVTLEPKIIFQKPSDYSLNINTLSDFDSHRHNNASQLFKAFTDRCPNHDITRLFIELKNKRNIYTHSAMHEIISVIDLLEYQIIIGSEVTDNNFFSELFKYFAMPLEGTITDGGIVQEYVENVLELLSLIKMKGYLFGHKSTNENIVIASCIDCENTTYAINIIDGSDCCHYCEVQQISQQYQ